VAVDQSVAKFPDYCRRHHRDRDREDGRKQTTADLAAIEPHDRVDPPNFQERNKTDDRDHAGYGATQ